MDLKFSRERKQEVKNSELALLLSRDENVGTKLMDRRTKERKTKNKLKKIKILPSLERKIQVVSEEIKDRNEKDAIFDA